MQKFKVGDRVRVREWDDMVKEFGTKYDGMAIGGVSAFSKGMDYLCGQTGTVVSVASLDTIAAEVQSLDIDWDVGEIMGWALDNTMFELIIDNPKIVITTDGKTTTAKLYNNKSLCETAIAKCSPEDKFDFNIGAKLAMDRLMEAVEGDTNTKPDDVINVGDRVRIIDDGGVFATYDSWISKNAPQYTMYYAFGVDLPTDQLKNIYCVLKKAPHHDTGEMLCLISTDGVPIPHNVFVSFRRYKPCYLIRESSLTKVTQ